MARVTLFQREVLGFPITAAVTRAGDDLLVQVAGGCREHIGSVSTARFENEELKIDSLLLPHHRDDVVGDKFAKALAERSRATVTVVCGIHFDSPGRDGIREIVECTDSLLEDILSSDVISDK